MTDLLSSLVDHPTIYSRNEIRYIVARNWRSDAKRDAMQALKAAKASGCCETCSQAVEDVAEIVRQLHGPQPAAVITSVPCGHSRVPDCFGRRLAEGVAEKLGIAELPHGPACPFAAPSALRPARQRIGRNQHRVL